ncbi:uncharacterized protein LOC112602829 [Melanaphis sacchari]|uniref:uncharacterized protein LOC112602829 n=1 Tax=Melanaphis sacchari TaxID=742174 RepID=UPI000DC12F10|nr:uncharacterized protein LOC112602829 [Melanaphis sacchari]
MGAQPIETLILHPGQHRVTTNPSQKPRARGKRDFVDTWNNVRYYHLIAHNDYRDGIGLVNGTGSRKPVRPDVHVSTTTKGPPPRVPASRPSKTGNSQTLFGVFQKCSICVRVFGHVPEGILHDVAAAAASPQGGSWNFRRETAFQALWMSTR